MQEFNKYLDDLTRYARDVADRAKAASRLLAQCGAI